MSRRQQVRSQTSTRPHRRLGDRLPGVAGISMSAVGGYFLAQFFAGYMNANYGEGYVNPVPAARENTLTDPGYELGAATATFALLTLSIAVPPLYDWLMADGSRLRSFITAISDYCSSCGRDRSAYAGLESDDDDDLLGVEPRGASWHHTAEGKLTRSAYLSNVWHVALRIGSAASFAGVVFSAVAVQPMANQFIPFELSADDDQNPEIVARAQTLAAQIGLPVIVVAQFLAALPAWATLLTYTEEPAIYPKQGTFFDKLCYFNAIFSDLFVIHRAKQNGSELPFAGNTYYQPRHREQQPIESLVSESEMQLIVAKRLQQPSNVYFAQNNSPEFVSVSLEQQPLESFGGSSLQRQVPVEIIRTVDGRAAAVEEASQGVDKTGSFRGQFSFRGRGAHKVQGTPFDITRQASVRRNQGATSAEFHQLGGQSDTDGHDQVRLRSSTNASRHSGNPQVFLAAARSSASSEQSFDLVEQPHADTSTIPGMSFAPADNDGDV